MESLSILPQITITRYISIPICLSCRSLYLSNKKFLICFWSGCNQRSLVSEKTRTRTPFKRTPPKFLELPRGPSESKYLFRRRLCLSNGNGEIRRIPHVLGDRDGVIIVDHGSRRKESNLMLSWVSSKLSSSKLWYVWFFEFLLLQWVWMFGLTYLS